ncbi:MAG: hypothetical protein ACFFEV_03050 [Candidatus Thorarchaeota archaeon]
MGYKSTLIEKGLLLIMRRRKGARKIDDVSVSKLLDDFVDLDVEDDNKRAADIDDEEYIKMMIEKEERRKLVRSKRSHLSPAHDEVLSTQSDPVEKSPAQPMPFPEETFPATCESDLSPEDEADIDEIMKTQDMMSDQALIDGMKASQELLREKKKSRELKRAARKTLDKYRKEQPDAKKKKRALGVSEKRAPIKRCQSCYFCVGEKKISGSCWCHCTNSARSTHAVVKGSWVKSRMNLPCWKDPQE